MTPHRRPLGHLATLVALLFAVNLATGCSDEPDGDAKKAEDAGVDAGNKDAGGGDDTFENNWVQGYTVIIDFHGSYPDGKKVRIDRDLYDRADTKQFFSFGSTHYSLGEIGFALTESLTPEIDGKTLPLEFQLNFGLVKGSSANPVHVGKPGKYKFSCKAPEVRVSFMSVSYRSTCDGLDGEFEITDWSNETGGEFRGTFEGRIARYFDKSSKPDPCKPDQNKLMCKQPETYATVKGWFGFTLPNKDGDQ